MIFHSMRKAWEDPSAAEGIDQIVRVSFQPQFADSAEQKAFYRFY